MRWRNTNESWGLVARGFHWLMALLVVVQAGLGWVVHDMARSPLKIDMMTGHKSLGITLLLLLVVRVLWRWTGKAPQPPLGESGREAVLSKVVHGLLYLLIAAMCLSGWISASSSVIPWKFWWLVTWPRITETDKALNELAGQSHEILLWLLLLFIAGHVLAALRHHFIKKNDILKRMWKGTLLAALMLVVTSTLNASEVSRWRLATVPGELNFAARYENEELSGRFNTFDVELVGPEDGKFHSLRVIVEIGSADMNDREINDALGDPDWFNTQSFPTAVFESSNIIASGDRVYAARGTLEMKGYRQELEVPFSWAPGSDRAVMSGQLELSRLDWDIGGGEWQDTSAIANAVRVEFQVQFDRVD